MNTYVYLFLFLIFTSLSAVAVDTPFEFEDSKQEERYKKLIEELRCLVCQNQSLADSNADLAQDFRDEIYKKILEGQSNSEIINYLVTRYGDFVLYKPPVKIRTILLWFGPFALLITAVLIAVFIARRRQKISSTPLTNEEEQKLNELLNRSSKGE